VTLRDLPNLISILRILLVAPVAIMLMEKNYLMALILFLVAGISDGIDGYLARRLDCRTRLGAFLDPFADKLLMLVCYLSLGWLGELPIWLVGAVIGRDILIVAGAAFYHYLVENMEVRPSLLSKLNTVLQILLVVVVLMALAGAPLPEVFVQFMIWAVLASTVLSGLGYLLEWLRLTSVALRDNLGKDHTDD